jgi:hypothetical protein
MNREISKNPSLDNMNPPTLNKIDSLNIYNFLKKSYPANSMPVTKKKAILSLSFVWMLAIVICVLLFFWNRTTNNDDLYSFTPLKVSSDQKNLFDKNCLNQKKYLNPTDAFVFVKINRKYVITAFPANQTPETNFTAKNFIQKTSGAERTTATRIIRKLNPRTPAKKEDFSIKPVIR